LLILPLLLSSGCSSTPKVDWDSRIGSFTHDQAVVELGPPDRTAELSDGSRVSEWFLKENPRMSVGFGVGSYGSHGGVGVGQTVSGGRSGQYLQLTFSPNGLLQRWGKITR
jgi:hypothetical protein